jgi:uncharacterized membrane protein (UPF0127 family)
MDRRTYLAVAGVGLGSVAGCLGDSSTAEFDAAHEAYDTTVVQISDERGEQRGSLTALIAETDALRYLGLSDTKTLPDSRGMLFVYESAGPRTFVMREMDFGLDIIYISAGNQITAIHHAEAPAADESGTEPQHRYPGEGQYVLEVSYEWTTHRDITTGDRVSFEL